MCKVCKLYYGTITSILLCVSSLKEQIAMSDIKVDKISYLNMMKTVKSILERFEVNPSLSTEMQTERKYLQNYIEREQDIIILMEQRKLFYDFYVMNNKTDPVSAGQMYRKYLEVNDKIKKLREET